MRQLRTEDYEYHTTSRIGLKANAEFAKGYILTDGGPGSLTEVTNYYAFIQAFNFSFLGYSSAITVVLVGFTVLLSWLILRLVGWGRDVE